MIVNIIIRFTGLAPANVDLSTSSFQVPAIGSFDWATRRWLLTVSIKRLDARSLERIGKVKAQVVETETYTVSPNGRMMTVKQEGEG